MIINKIVSNVKTDGNYTVVEFQDGTLLPACNLRPHDGLNRCVFCNKSEIEVPLCSLDNLHCICKDCTIKALTIFSQQGHTIDLDLTQMAPNIAKKLGTLLEGTNNNDKTEEQA